MYKLLYYFSITVLGYIVLRDSPVLVPELGGSGDFYNMFKGWPYLEHPPIYKYYYLISMGYHIGQLITHIWIDADPKKNDFIEMALHHGVTVYLFGFSYMGNFIIGGPVTFLHNWADICISWSRMWGETIYYNGLAKYSFVLSQFVWIYSRIYVFGKLIIVCMSVEVFVVSSWLQPTFGFLLGCLYILHIYWVVLMLKIILRAFFENKLEDTINNVKKNE